MAKVIHLSNPKIISRGGTTSTSLSTNVHAIFYTFCTHLLCQNKYDIYQKYSLVIYLPLGNRNNRLWKIDRRGNLPSMRQWLTRIQIYK